MKTPVIATLAIIGAVAIGIVSVRGTATFSNRQKPIKIEYHNTMFKAPPFSLEGMIAEADLVIVGRLVGSDARYEPDGVHLLTAHRVKVDELLHIKSGFAPPGAELLFVRNGGELDEGTHVKRVVEESFPPLTNGNRYVLFLFWNRALDAWRTAFGPDSVLDVTSGKVLSPGKAAIIDSIRGKDATEIIDAVRRGSVASSSSSPR